MERPRPTPHARFGRRILIAATTGVTRLYVPAYFVKSVRIWQGDALLLSVEGGISIAENPEFRFDYRPNDATGFRAEVDDSEGKSFSQEWPAARA